jgi:VanZ family protein
VLIAALVFAASSRSRVASPEGIAHVDKFAHFGVYALLGTLIARTKPGWRGAWRGLWVASLFGATDEWHQAFVPGRSPDLGDWVADTTGAALAVALYAGVGWYRRLLEWPLGWPRPTAALSPVAPSEHSTTHGPSGPG